MLIENANVFGCTVCFFHIFVYNFLNTKDYIKIIHALRENEG